eukprot:6053746-Prymnesium_polylepis.1
MSCGLQSVRAVTPSPTSASCVLRLRRAGAAACGAGPCRSRPAPDPAPDPASRIASRRGPVPLPARAPAVKRNG